MAQDEAFYIVDQNSVAAEVIDGEAVIINVATSVYFATEGVGGWLWEHLAKGATAESLAHALVGQFDVDLNRARTDVAAFVGDLLEEKLILEKDGSPEPAGQAATAAQKAGYVPPKLNTFRDMSDLLALDPPMPSLDPGGWNGDAKQKEHSS